MRTSANLRTFLILCLGLFCAATSARAESPIFPAVLSDDPAQVAAVIKADPNVVKATDDLTKATPLINACELRDWAKNRNKIIAILLDNGADPNAKNFIGDTALHHAASAGNIEAVKLLLAAGADSKAANDEGETPLKNAARDGHIEIAELLLAGGAKIKDKTASGCGPLYEAAKEGNKQIAVKLIDAGAEVDQTCGSYSRTPLDVACAQGHLEVIKVLVAHGADINYQDGEGFNALHHAAFWDRRKEAAFLLVRGADKNAIDIRGRTPLHQAAKEGHRIMAELLISYGADINAVDAKGKTPLDLAKSEGYINVAAYLEKKGGKPGK